MKQSKISSVPLFAQLLCRLVSALSNFVVSIFSTLFSQVSDLRTVITVPFLQLLALSSSVMETLVTVATCSCNSSLSLVRILQRSLSPIVKEPDAVHKSRFLRGFSRAMLTAYVVVESSVGTLRMLACRTNNIERALYMLFRKAVPLCIMKTGCSSRAHPFTNHSKALGALAICI